MIPSRAAALRRLQDGVDVLVIGGGITGAGVALDAVSRGYTVGLVEQADFAAGTSSRSTKLVHGGLRYVPQLQLDLVREAAAERDLLLRLAPHLVRPLPFLVPLYAGARRPLGLPVPSPLRPLMPLGLRAGLWAYARLAGGGRPHRRVPPSRVRELCPALRTDGLVAAYQYFDAQTDDVRLVHAVLAEARRRGALTVNYASAEEIAAAARVIVRDTLGGARLSVPVRHVVNAAGVWAERVAALTGAVPFRLQFSKGAHLILDCPELCRNAALVIPETDDGRLAFVVPWRDRVILGTTDDPYADDPAAVRTAAAEARYLLAHLNRYLTAPVDAARVVGAYAGLRPLVRRGDAATSALPRSHAVVTHGGVVSVVGGKLTTYRKMAQDAVDALVRRDGRTVPCRTHTIPLDETASGGAETVHQAAARAGIAPEGAAHLWQAYGGRAERIIALAASAPELGRPLLPGLPVIAGEVVFACREEQCVTLADWLLLRSRLAILDPEHGRGCLAAVAALMARELGWPPDEVRRQIASCEQAVDAEMAFTRELAGPGQLA